MGKTWDEIALKARKISKKIINGDETNHKGERLTYIVDRLDIFASDALNKLYYGKSKASIHTYKGGLQIITTEHLDGTIGEFDTDGLRNSSNNPMDIEIIEYLEKTINENTDMKTSKNVIRINESQLKQMISESVKKVLSEAYGIDLNDTLKWVQKKFPEKSPLEQERFAQNIINKNQKFMELYKDALGAMSIFDLDFNGWFWGYDGEIDEETAKRAWTRAEMEYKKRLKKRGYEDVEDFMDTMKNN